MIRGPDQPDSCDPGLSNECPAARRYFLTDATLDAAYDRAKVRVSEAGFSVSDEGTAGCAIGSSNGPPCGFFADRGSDQLHVGVYASPDQAGLDEVEPEGITVVIRAYASD